MAFFGLFTTLLQSKRVDGKDKLLNKVKCEFVAVLHGCNEVR